jgi:hypothetical protein
MKECIAREPTLERYLALVRMMESYFRVFTVEYIECLKMPKPADVFFQVLEDASVKTVLPKPRVINIIEGEDWRALIRAYLRHYYEPDNKKRANQNVAASKRLSNSRQ